MNRKKTNLASIFLYDKGLFFDARPKGMAMASAVILTMILGIWIMAFNNYQKNKVFIASVEGRTAVADAAAEAALNLVIAELRMNNDFLTQKTKSSTTIPGDSTQFDGPFSPMPSTLIKEAKDSDGNVMLSNVGINASKGIYEGKIGDCDFKVKVGRQISLDNANTLAIKENIAFLRIEAVARYNLDPSISRRLFATIMIDSLNKYNYYDGDELLLVFGTTGDTVPNTLETGYLYGHNDLSLGTIGNNGNKPPLYLKNIDGIHTGYNGKINISTDAEIRISHDFMMASPVYLKNSGGYEKFSTVAAEKAETAIETLNGLLRDRGTGALDIDLSADNIRSQAKRRAESGNGILISQSAGGATVKAGGGAAIPVSTCSYKNDGTGEGGIDTIRIDFGLMKTAIGENDDAIVDNSGNLICKLEYSGDFNGMIYSELPLQIWGNPDRDIAIYSEKDIYIIGDFNMRTDTSEAIAMDGSFRCPVQQDYDDESLFKYIKQGNYESANGQEQDKKSRAYWNYVEVISEGRIWWDYRDPRYWSANECKPLLELELFSLLLANYDQVPSFVASNSRPTVTNIATALGIGVLENTRTKLLEFPSSWPPTSSTALQDYLDGNGGNYLEPNDCGPGVLAQDTVMHHLASYCNNHSEMALDEGFGAIKAYLATTLNITDTDALNSIHEMLWNTISDKKITVGESQAMANLIWKKAIMKMDMTNAQKVFEITGGLIDRLAAITITPNISGSGRLYPPTTGISGNSGIFSHFRDEKFKKDRLYIPEMAVNCKAKDMGVRNATWKSHPEVLDKDNYNGSPNQVFSGVYSPSGYVTRPIDTIREISTLRTMMGNKSGGLFGTYAINNSFIMRKYGGFVHLRKNPSPAKNTFGYSPPIRRILFDPNFISPFDLNAFSPATYVLYRIEEADYNGF